MFIFIHHIYFFFKGCINVAATTITVVIFVSNLVWTLYPRLVLERKCGLAQEYKGNLQKFPWPHRESLNFDKAATSMTVTKKRQIRLFYACVQYAVCEVSIVHTDQMHFAFEHLLPRFHVHILFFFCVKTIMKKSFKRKWERWFRGVTF